MAGLVDTTRRETQSQASHRHVDAQLSGGSFGSGEQEFDCYLTRADSQTLRSDSESAPFNPLSMPSYPFHLGAKWHSLPCRYRQR